MIKKISQLNRLPETIYQSSEDIKANAEKILFEASYLTGHADETQPWQSYSTTLSTISELLEIQKLENRISAIETNGISVITDNLSVGLPGSTTERDRLGHVYHPNTQTTADVYSELNIENDSTFHGKTAFHNNVVISCNDEDNTNNPILKVHGIASFDQTIQGTAFRALWGDLAEIYSADANYEPGTLVAFGGEKEVTIATEKANAVVTSKPAVILNDAEKEKMEFPVGVALVGRVPVKVRGPVKKFDNIVLSKTDPGVGVVYNYSIPYEIIGRALEANEDPGEKLVLCATRFSLT